LKRFKDYTQNQQYLLPPSESELIESRDLVRVVNTLIDSLNLKEFLSNFKGGGCPSYHPVMMLKVLMYAYCQRVYSSRGIAKLLKRDINFMWLSGRQTPDYRTINRFRGEVLKDNMVKIFGEVTLLLIEKGYVKGQDFFVDGTTLEADANKHKIIWRKNTERYKKKVQDRAFEILSEIDELNEEEDKYYEGEDLPEYGKPGAITSVDIEKTVERINEKLSPKTKKELKTLESKLKKYEDQEKTLNDRNSYSKTDPDATAMRMKDKSIKPAYNVQVSTEFGFSVNYSVGQERSDVKAFVAHFKNLKVKPKRMIGDSGYGSEENFKELEEAGVESYLKYSGYNAEIKNKLHPFSKDKFNYDPDQDNYTCPKGTILNLESVKDQHKKEIKIYRAKGCSFCTAQTVCCYSPRSRSIQRSEELERLKGTTKDNLNSELGKELYKRRGNEVESIFGIMKHVKKYCRVRLRGLKKAETDLGLMLVSMNFTKIAIDMAKPAG
jgi:transposase